MVKLFCQGEKFVGLAFITPQTSEEATIVDDDDNSNTTKPAGRGIWVRELRIGCFEVEDGRGSDSF